MDLKKKIERDINRKEKEIQSLTEEMRGLEVKIAEANAAVEALQGALKYLPDAGNSNESVGTELREGSKVQQAQNVLELEGAPLHIKDIIAAMGLKPTKNERAALAGQLSSYVRQGRFFTRPKPNTFGLVEWANKAEQSDIPTSFGEVDLS